MSVLYVVLLGIVQGITEFLPVSSFGHLSILEGILGIQRGPGVLLETMLHMGTVFAIILVFFKDIRQISVELLGMAADLVGNVYIYFHNKKTGANLRYARIVHTAYRKFAALVIVSLIPSVMLGYAARRVAVMAAASNLFPGIGLLATGVILLVVDFSRPRGDRTPGATGYHHAMWIGICQGISVFPGISRSGLTISAGLFCGLSRKFAIRYSYIMAVPVIIGAMIMELSGFTSSSMTIGLGFTYLLGMIVAAVTGSFTARFLLAGIQKIRFRYFAFYCFAAGLIGLAVNFAG